MLYIQYMAAIWGTESEVSKNRISRKKREKESRPPTCSEPTFNTKIGATSPAAICNPGQNLNGYAGAHPSLAQTEIAA